VALYPVQVSISKGDAAKISEATESRIMSATSYHAQSVDPLCNACPPARIGIMEVVVLRPEGLGYGAKLKDAGVGVVYKGAPHAVVSMTSKLCC
jgi:acetyl esterase/lipase